jgi:hypothetical protein
VTYGRSVVFKFAKQYNLKEKKAEIPWYSLTLAVAPLMVMQFKFALILTRNKSVFFFKYLVVTTLFHYDLRY